MGDTINLSGKKIIIIIIILLLLSGTLAGFFISHSENNQGPSGNSGNSQTQPQTQDQNITEKCRLPAGQDLSAWKEHLGHHAETQDCLRYFE